MNDCLDGQALWQRILAVTDSALASGALQRIDTRCLLRRVCHGAATVDFQVRVVRNLARKTREQRERINQKKHPHSFNPFMPYDPALYVGELTPHYRCLMNKFNVVEHHILMVTNRFVAQREPLDREDFVAALLCLQAMDGLVFYNGGALAGASVEHKHLQMIPLPLSPADSFPLARWLAPRQLLPGEIVRTTLPFPHRVAGVAFRPDAGLAALGDDAQLNLETYRRVLQTLGIAIGRGGLMSPHNLLMTRSMLWVVPRSRDSFCGFPVNALGFAGTLLAADQRQLQQLDEIGCLALLQAVTDCH